MRQQRRGMKPMYPICRDASVLRRSKKPDSSGTRQSRDIRSACVSSDTRLQSRLLVAEEVEIPARHQSKPPSCARLFNGFVISNPSGRFQFCPLFTSGLSLPASGGGFSSIGQVGEWLKPTDCKSVPPCEVRRFESFPVHQRNFWPL